jgi:hypothetical protein
MDAFLVCESVKQNPCAVKWLDFVLLRNKFNQLTGVTTEPESYESGILNQSTVKRVIRDQ